MYCSTWWLIPVSKWIITPVISELTLLSPVITRGITYLLSGMGHQVYYASIRSRLLSNHHISQSQSIGFHQTRPNIWPSQRAWTSAAHTHQRHRPPRCPVRWLGFWWVSPYLVGGWPTPLKNMSSSIQWEGLSHILWKIKHVPNHQPAIWSLSWICWAANIQNIFPDSSNGGLPGKQKKVSKSRLWMLVDVYDWCIHSKVGETNPTKISVEGGGTTCRWEKNNNNLVFGLHRIHRNPIPLCFSSPNNWNSGKKQVVRAWKSGWW